MLKRTDDTKPKVRMDTLTITPEMASKFLENAYNANRLINQSAVEDYAADMRSGIWDENGQTLSFAPDGRVLNGHHRLWACVMSGVPFTTGVAYNVNPKTFSTMDVGHSKRSAGDMIYISGTKKNYKYIAAASLLCLRYNSDTVMRRKKYAPREVLEYFNAHPTLEEYVAAARKGGKGGVGTYATPLGACTYLASVKYRQRAFDFLDSLHSGADLAKGSPVLALRNRLMRSGEQRTIQTTAEERFGLIIMGWNAYIENRELTRMQLWAEKFPKIKGASR